MAANSDRDEPSAEFSMPPVGHLPVGPQDCARQLQALEQVCQQLQRALSNERDVSLAVGIIMVSQRLTRADAFSLLRSTARSQRRKLADVAAEYVLAAQAQAIPKSREI